MTAARLATIEDTAAANLAEARRFVRDLASPALDKSLPARSPRSAAARGAPVPPARGLRASSVCRDAAELTDRQRTLFIRATRSSSANVLSHARATRVVVTLEGWDDAVALDVVDDGVGFDPRSCPRADSFGLSTCDAARPSWVAAPPVESSRAAAPP
ncbi:hypothetical protein QJS66_06940 [Kocuria rhizophila]|nr:hypothetical protein QJS66_06940 [Kocuria rhizophila]